MEIVYPTCCCYNSHHTLVPAISQMRRRLFQFTQFMQLGTLVTRMKCQGVSFLSSLGMPLLYIKPKVSVEYAWELLLIKWFVTGMTLGKAIVKTCKREYQHGLLYTACTRVTNDNDLAFIGHEPTLVGNKFKFPSIQRYSCQFDTSSMLYFLFFVKVQQYPQYHWPYQDEEREWEEEQALGCHKREGGDTRWGMKGQWILERLRDLNFVTVTY